MVLLGVLIFVITYIQSYFPPERTKKILGRFHGIGANCIAALLGTVTPFCSCSSIPLFMGFTSAGLPLGVTFSFLISSPMVDLGSLVLLMSIFGWKVAIIYVLVGLVIAVAGGTLIEKLHLEDQVEEFIRNGKGIDTPQNELTKRDRMKYAWEQVVGTAKKVFPYVIVGVGILHYHRLISSILAQATRDRLVPFNIADHNYMKAPKLEQSEAAFLDEEQARHVLELLNDEPLKWKVAMYLLMFSGVRRGELLGLEWKDIDFDKRIIHIKRTSQYVQHMGIITKSPKNATSYRTVKLPEFVFDLLREYQAYWNKLRNDMLDRWEHFITITLADGSTQTIRNDRLFIKDDTTPMNPDSLTDWTSNFVKRNKLPHFTPHSLRHTHATLLIAEGVSIPTVSRRLGHSSITTTSKIYVHAIQSADEVASDVIDGKLNPFHHDNDKEEAK